ncbi:MAG: hypothetical protein ACTSWN_07390 [Promethearchaeota archaeon]
MENITFNKYGDKKEIVEKMERVSSIFEKYIARFDEMDLQQLAGKWKRILTNYRNAVTRKIIEEQA